MIFGRESDLLVALFPLFSFCSEPCLGCEGSFFAEAGVYFWFFFSDFDGAGVVCSLGMLSPLRFIEVYFAGF